MADLVSPGVQVKEKDLTASVRSEPTSIGATAIISNWGPMNEVITISDETELVSIFGKPNGTNYLYWFSAANFLAYSNTLKVVQMQTTGAKNACQTGTAVLIPNTTTWLTGDGTQGPYSGGQATGIGEFTARFPGTKGNSLKVSTCWTGQAVPATYEASEYYTQDIGDTTSANAVGAGELPGAALTVSASMALQVNDIISFGVEGPYNVPPDATALAEQGQKYKVTSYSGTSLRLERYPKVNAKGLKTAIDGSTTAVQINRYWQYWDQFDGPPGTSTWMKNKQGGLTTGKDEMHIIVIDELGDITGAPGTILEKHSNLSKMLGAVTDSGDNNYYVDALYLGSSYIYWVDHPTGATNWGTEPDASTPSTSTAALLSTVGQTNSYSGGVGGVTPTEGERALAFDYFADSDSVDFNLLISGPATVNGATGTAHAIDLIDLVEKRKDSVVFLSPYSQAVVPGAAGSSPANSYQKINNVTSYFDSLPSSSYAVFDSGYKKIYDKYNDTFRWVPLNADIAGACARTDAVEDPWWSPGGLNRGQIRGAIELALNPTQVERDTLYRARVNPVVTFPGEGTVLWGDKTALAQTSAFDRINVRRLFITIEEAIAKASRTVLFEFNDTFTRENFLGMVNPYLRDVMARRGITDFLAVCDETNNTGQVIDNNEFRADIYVKPARSINFITLTFIATRTDVAFSEVVGRA